MVETVIMAYLAVGGIMSLWLTVVAAVCRDHEQLVDKPTPLLIITILFCGVAWPYAVYTAYKIDKGDWV